MRIITFLTDFGTKDGYVAQMKGVASGITDAQLVDITHEVTLHHIREAAFLLRSTAPFFPAGTVHCVVVDPGVGTSRRGLVITTKTQILVGPDNGVLLPAAHHLGDFVVYEIMNRAYMQQSLSNTFHGRDVFTPVAAYITKGVPFGEIGRRITDFVDLDFGHGESTGDRITGNIIYCDHFGNLITNISAQIVPKQLEYHKKIIVASDVHQWEMTYVPSYGFVQPGELLAAVGSSMLLEIGVNQGNASQILGLKENDRIEIRLV